MRASPPGAVPLMAVLLAAVGAAGAAAPAPHIVYMLADNIGWGGVGWLRAESPAGPSPEVATPTLDALAAEGARLDRFYAYKMCSPSRSALLSGRLPVHVNFHNSEQEQPGAGIPLGMTTIAEKLRGAGYRTHHVGKWHVGYASPAHQPAGRGFDTSLGYMHAYNGYMHGWGRLKCPGVGAVSYAADSPEGRACTAASVKARKLQYTADLWDTDRPAAGINGTQFEEFIFRDRAVSIIERHNRSEPLFLFYAMHTLHSPLCAPPEYLSRFSAVDNEDRRHVAAMTALMDDVVSNVTSALQRAGLWQSTLFIWTSDNGAAIELVTGAKSAYPLRGGYYTNWEGGVRAPALMAGGFLPSAARRRSFTGYVHIADWYATFCRLAGVSAVDAAAAARGLPAVDSLDVWGYISGADASSPRTEWPLTPLKGDTGAHGGDSAYIAGEWKLILNNVSQASWCGPSYPNNSITWDTWGTVEQCTTPAKKGCLFNIFADPTEQVDRALEMPHKVEQILQKMIEAEKTVYDPWRGPDETSLACAAAAAYGGFVGPWRNLSAP